jgi:allantoicase
LSSEQAGIKAEMRNIKHGYSIRCVRNPGTTSAQPVQKKTGFILFPNPTYGEITIQLEQTGGADVFIYSLTGELVYGSKIKDTINRLELSHLSSGLYIVKVGNRDFCKTERLLVQ